METSQDASVRGLRLLAAAEQVANAMPDALRQGMLLLSVAGLTALVDPERAERIVRDIPALAFRRQGLCQVAKVVAGTDATRTMRLLDEAEQVPHALGEEDHEQLLVRGSMARVAESVDPTRAARLWADAEDLAYATADEAGRASNLGLLASLMADTNPGRAGLLLEEAEHVARALADGEKRLEALGRCVTTASRVDPTRAPRIALAVADLACALAAGASSDLTKRRLVTQVAATDLDQAERITWTIGDENTQLRALAEVLECMAATDTARAEHIARTATGGYRQTVLLAAVAGALTGSDRAQATRLVDVADRIAQRLPEDRRRNEALKVVVTALAEFDPDRALSMTEHFIGSSERPDLLAEIGLVLARTHPDRAERIARSLPTDIFHQNLVSIIMAATAATLLRTDPDRSEQIVGTIGDDTRRALALLDLAKRCLDITPG